MVTCERCADLIWDDLYGLLNADQTAELRDHVAGCPACRAAQAEAEAQQRLVAKAARLYGVVAPFAVPEAGEAQAPTPAAPPPDEAPAPGETTPVLTMPRRTGGRWSWLAAAAALLLAAGAGVGGYVWYGQALAQHRQDRDEARLALARKDKEITETRDKAQAEINSLPEQVRARQLHLWAEGPAQYTAGAPTQYRVVARNADGRPADVHCTARVVASGKDAPNQRQVLAEQDFKSQGEAVVSLATGQPAPPDAVLSLEVVADRGKTREVVTHALTATGPGYLTHLAIDKAIYRKGEILFFRTLTLDRFSDRPAPQTLAVKATVVDGQGARHVLYAGPTRSDGVGCGQLALTSELAEGECALEVAEASGRFPPVQRRFLLVPQEPDRLKKELRFDQATYRPGDEVRANFQARQVQDGAAAANRKVTAKVKLGDMPAPGPVTAPPTNSKGESEVRFQLPAKIPNNHADLEIKIKDGNRYELYRQPIPMNAPRSLAAAVHVEFFPEGGQLVAGLPGRVYLRAYTAMGQPAELQAVLVDQDGRVFKDGKGRDVKVSTQRQQGLGVFGFTPQAGKLYTLRMTLPASGPVQVPQLVAEEAGVTLSVPDGVGKEGEPLRVLVRQTGSGGDLYVTAAWRGRLVDQKAVAAGEKETWVRLEPPTGVHGILRVTVYRSVAGTLDPLAERLVYRLPAKRLDITTKADQTRYSPGQRVKLSIHTANEKGQPLASGLLAAVVDEEALRPADRSVGPAPYYLTSEVRRPEDLEVADLWVRDDAASYAALDRFLGTQGWRRFVRPAREKVLARGDRAEAATDSGATVAILNIDNAAKLRDNDRNALAAAAGLKRQAEERVGGLREDWRRLADQDVRAENALANFEQLPQELRYLALSVLVPLIFLVAGCLALVIGLVRAVRGKPFNTPYFATAFACLLVCTVIMFLGRQGKLADAPAVVARTDPRPEPATPLRNPRPAVADEREPAGARLLASLPRKTVAPAAEELLGRNGMDLAMLRHKNLVESALAYSYQNAKAKAAREKPQLVEPLRKRYEDLRENQRRSVAPKNHEGKKDAPKPLDSIDKSLTPARGGMDSGKGKEAPVVPVEYAHLHPSGKGRSAPDLQETVLWSPVLKAADGKARVTFDLSDKQTTYRVLVQGHTVDGRLGIVQGELKAGPPKTGGPSSSPNR
jgi:hypothetical protein